MRCGAVIPVRPGEWKHLGATVQAIEAAGWSYAFSDEGPFAGNNDSIAAALYMATNSSRISVGSSVAISYLRHPYNTASLVSIINEVSDDRMVLGLGCSHPAINTPLGIEMPKPVTEMREYVASVRHHLGDEDRTPIWIAALRPPMARLAGAIADTVNFHHNPLNTFDQVVDAVREGERKVERTDHCQIALYARIAMSDDLGAARRVGRATMRGYCSLPTYRELYAKAGFEDEMESLARALEIGDDDAADRAITDQLLDDVLLLGPPARCREQLERFKASGVDIVLFAPLSLTPVSGIDELFAPIVAEFAGYESD